MPHEIWSEEEVNNIQVSVIGVCGCAAVGMRGATDCLSAVHILLNRSIDCTQHSGEDVAAV